MNNLNKKPTFNFNLVELPPLSADKVANRVIPTKPTKKQAKIFSKLK